MIKKINFKFAVNAMLVLLTTVIVFHLSILAEVVPYQVVWGGRLENLSKMRVFEMISITINLLILSIIAIKGGYIRASISSKMANVALWVIIVLFAINTVGNVFSKSSLEAIIFTPLTFLSAVLCYRIIIESI